MTNAPFNIPNSNDEVINHEQFEEMRDLLEEDFDDLVTAYIADSKQRIALLRTAQAAGDNANGFEAAHAIKGASANLGAIQLMDIAADLQEACRENTISQCAALIQQADSALVQLEQAIHQRLGQ